MTRGVLPVSVTEDIIKLSNEAEIKCLKEGKKFNLSGLLRPTIISTLTKYIQDHGDGNPGFDLKQWIDNPEFQATPSLFRTEEDIREFINSIKGTGRFQEIGSQLQLWVDIFNQVESL